MAQIVVDVPDAVVPRVLDAFAATYAYNPGSGLTKAQFAKQRLAAYVKQVTVAYEATRDAEAARQTSTQTATTDIAVT
jgi:hypothetical protein